MTRLSTELFKNSDSQGKRQLTVRLSPDQIKEIEALSDASGVSLAEATRRVIDEGLEARGEV